MVGTNPFKIKNRGFDMFNINAATITIFGSIAFGLTQILEKAGFNIFVGEFLCYMDRPGGVPEVLDGLNAGNIIEEPAATGEHELAMTLHLQKF